MSLELHDVSCGYSGRKKSGLVFEKASLVFPNKGLLCVLGKSGSGKSTLLFLLAGFLKPLKGQVMRDKNQSFSFVLQDNGLMAGLKAQENVSLPLLLRGKKEKERERFALEAMKVFGIEGLKDKKPAEMSGGECLRVGLARALAHGGEIVLADEPTGALDSENALKAMELLKEISKTRLVVCVTHNHRLAYGFADYIALVGNGTIKYEREYGIARETPRKLPVGKGKARIGDSLKTNLAMIRGKTGRFFSASLAVGLALGALLLSLTFGANAKAAAIQLTSNYYADDVLRMSRTTNVSQTNGMALTRQEELQEDDREFLGSRWDAAFFPPLSFFLPDTLRIRNDGKTADVSMEPSFGSGNLKVGENPDEFNEIVINESLCNEMDIKATDAMGMTFPLKVMKEVPLIVGESTVQGTYSLDVDLAVVGVAAEQAAFNSPVAFYDYRLARDFLGAVSVSPELGLTVEETLVRGEYLNSSLRSYSTLVVSPDALKIHEYFRDENDSYGIVAKSRALDARQAVRELIEAISSLASVFLSLICLVAFFLELVAVSTIVAEEKRDFAIARAFCPSSRAFWLFSFGLKDLMFLGSALAMMTFYCLGWFLGRKLLSDMLLPMSLLSFSLPIFSLVVLSSYALAFFASLAPLLRISGKGMVLSLRSER